MGFLQKIIKRKNNKPKTMELDYKRLPAHIAIIMDGNGRWAKKRNIPKNLGHREGANTLKKIVAYCDKIGIKYLTVYAFSTENWKRPKSEVDALMSLLLEFLKNADRELAGKNVSIRIIGNVKALSDVLQKEISRVTKSTAGNTGMQLNIALNYGGREEIINAVRALVKDVELGNIKSADINEEKLSNRLYTAGVPDPDLLIRTSGEKRLSNYLLWQSAYTEFWYTDVLWPDFKEQDVLQAILEYQKRERRFGGI